MIPIKKKKKKKIKKKKKKKKNLKIIINNLTIIKIKGKELTIHYNQ